jgi:hypothetical protein
MAPGPTPASGLAVDERRKLVERVASSVHFQRSRRLRDFLFYTCGRVLQEPGVEIPEADIAVRVFEKPADFDPSVDTLVRVQASQVRKRLLQYFTTEGAGEPVVIEMPKGSYTPAFRERAGVVLADADEIADEPEPAEPRTPLPPSRAVVAAALAVLLLAAVLWLLVENHALRQRLRGPEPRPTAEWLWREMFGNGAPLQIVLADGTMTFFQDLIHRQLTVPEYQNGQFLSIAQTELTEPAERGIAIRLMNRQFTSLADTSLVHRLAGLSHAQGIHTELVHARNGTSQLFTGSRNTVLTGSRRANPWIELFEKRMSFETRFDEATRRGSFANASPQAGEDAVYPSGAGTTYCRVAYLPSLDGNGRVLILSGLDLPATDAGAEMITTEAGARTVGERLGLREGHPVPYFELMVRASRVRESATGAEIVAVHRLRTSIPLPAPPTR